MLLSARRLVVSVAASVLGALAFASAPALAAVEAPEVSVQLPVAAGSVTVHGLLDPGKDGGPGTFELGRYEFLYSKTSNKTGCRGEGKAPASPGISLGAGKESVSEDLSKLESNTYYGVCLLASNEFKEQAVSLEVSFKTESPPETPEKSKAEAVNSTSEKLHGVLNPKKESETGSYEFVYRASTTECQGEGEGKAGGEAHGIKEELVSNELDGLSPNMQYTFCLLARNEAGETSLSSPMTFTTFTQAPLIEGETFSKVGPSSAAVTSQVDMENSEGSYYYEYATTSKFSAGEANKTAVTSLAANNQQVSASAQITGLRPATEYHFRIIVKNTSGEIATGPELAFATLPSGLGGLPDDRAYEMVTPLENHNAVVDTPYDPFTEESEGGFIATFLPFQASAEGNAIAYESEPTTGGNGFTGHDTGNAQIATRSPGGVWTQTTIQPDTGRERIYQGFSSDLSVGVLNSCSAPALAPGAPLGVSYGAGASVYNVLYARTNKDGVYHPLFTTTPRNRLPERQFEEGGNFLGQFGTFGVAGTPGPTVFECSGALVYAGASGDFSHLLFEADDDLLEGEGMLEKEFDNDVKGEVEDQRPQMILREEAKQLLIESINLKNKGSAQEANEKAEESENKIEEAQALAAADHRNDRRNELYVSVGGRLALVNVLPNGAADPNATFGAQVSGAAPDFSRVISTDGSRIFWTDLNTGVVYVRENGSTTAAVSSGSAQFWTASGDGRYAFYTEAEKLYRFDAQNGTRDDITPEGAAHESAAVQGVIGASESGDRIYFVADGSLAPGASAGKPNLYVWDSGALSFIATLSAGDSSDWYTNMGSRTAETTPDGRALVFVSEESLTGYHNDGQNEVYVYEAEPSELFCASCKTTGEPGSVGYLQQSWSNTYIPRWLSDNGNDVFFDSPSALLPQATNDNQEVYEWERGGSGGCQDSAGCVYLLSGGTGEASFIDASSTGSDVFFVTTAQLVPEDTDGTADLYDVRVNGGPPAQRACSGTGCQGLPAAAPIFATPASVTFAGVGNFPAPTHITVKTKLKSKPVRCKKGYVREHGKCVKKKSQEKRSRVKKVSDKRRVK